MNAKYINLVSLMILINLLQGCEDEPPVTNAFTKNPIVNIISPRNNESIIDSTIIIVEAKDDKGVVQLEIYINNKTDSTKTFFVPPYNYLWKPTYDADSTKYSIYARAYDADGNVSTSKVILVYVREFGSPSNLRIESISKTEIILIWDDNSRVETGFEIERKDGNLPFKVIANLESNIISYLDDSLDIYKEYVYRIRAFNNNVYTIYSDEINISYKYEFKIENMESGHGLNGTWGSLYSPVRISNDNTIYSYSFENTPYFFTRQFSNPSNRWSYGLYPEEGTIFDVKFNYNDNKFLLATNQAAIYSWTAYSNIPLKKFLTESDTIYSVSFCKNKNIIASSEANGVITIWNYENQLKKQIIQTYTEGRTIILLLPEGNTLVSGDHNGKIKLWDVNNGALLKDFIAHDNKITQLIYNETQRIIISSSMDGFIKFWDLDNVNFITASFAHTGGVTDISMSFEGNKFITCGMDGTFRYFIYPEFIKVFQFSDYRLEDFLTVSLAPNGNKLLAGGNRYIGLYYDASSWIVN